MTDSDVFAILTAQDNRNRARKAFRLQHNSHSYCEATDANAVNTAEKTPTSSRESTPVPRWPAEETTLHADRILLRFSQPSKDRTRGWQFGTNLSVCDYLLGRPRTPGVSSTHFCIAINPLLRVQLHDKSRYRTHVGHDGKAADIIIKHDRRILCLEPGGEEIWGKVVVHVPEVGRLAFSIEFPGCRTSSHEYLSRLQTFVDESTEDVPPVDGLRFDSNPSTEPSSRQPQSPTNTKDSLFIPDRELGSGQFGTVHRVVDGREGDYYAAKSFTLPVRKRDGNKKRKKCQEEWSMDG